MEVRGFKTVEKRLVRENCDVTDVFEAFKLMQEMNKIKSQLEKLLKGNRSVVGIKEIVEAGFKPNQLTLVGPDFNIVRKEVSVGEKVTPAYNYYLYNMVAK